MHNILTVKHKTHLWLAETFVPGAGPLALGQGQFLLAAVETFSLVKEEVSLSDLGWKLQELLKLDELGPGLLDELITVDNVDLGEGEVSHPPDQVIMVDASLQRWVANVDVPIFCEKEVF